MTEQRIHITQGEYAVGQGDHVVITTLLGSCVSSCIWDETAKVGGMNHMLLAGVHAASAAATLADINAIEMLINELIKRGARRDRLQAKAFGGARMISGLSDIGQHNAEFTLRYLKSEDIPVVTQSLGGVHARNIRFWPGTGRVMQRVTETTVREVEMIPPKSGNDLELF